MSIFLFQKHSAGFTLVQEMQLPICITYSVKREQEQEVVIWSKKDRRLSRGTAPAQS